MFVTTSPGTTGPALIFINLAETADGAPGATAGAPGVVEVGGAPCPAVGNVAPGAVVILGVPPVKKAKYIQAPSPMTTIPAAAMIKFRCIISVDDSHARVSATPPDPNISFSTRQGDTPTESIASRV